MADVTPSRLQEALRGLADVLNALPVPWALVGGLAVSIRTEPRFTRDLDVVTSVASDAEAEQLVGALTTRGYRLQLSLEQTNVGRLAAVRLVPPREPDSGVITDLLFVSSGIEPEICRDAERVEVLPGLTVPVARTGHLIAMKLLATSPDRPQDDLDLQQLITHLTPEEEARARTAVSLIEDRGTHRGRTLRADLAAWLGRRGPGRAPST